MALEVALSFDDAPRGDGLVYTGIERTHRLISQLSSHQVNEVAFFCNTHEASAEIQQRLSLYSQAGHLLANHTAHHLDFHSSSFEQFTQDLLQADQELKKYSTFRPWFRFPFLSQGQIYPPSVSEKINSFLLQNGYRHGYITIETYDWHINHLYQQDLKNGRVVDLSKLKSLYLKVMEESLVFYDQLAQNLLGRSPKHIMLLHENDLNALFIGDLIDLIRSKGWKVIPITEAYQDALADQKWDGIPYSQRRLRAMARWMGYSGPQYCYWENTDHLTELYQSIFE